MTRHREEEESPVSPCRRGPSDEGPAPDPFRESLNRHPAGEPVREVLMRSLPCVMPFPFP